MCVVRGRRPCSWDIGQLGLGQWPAAWLVHGSGQRQEEAGVAPGASSRPQEQAARGPQPGSVFSCSFHCRKEADPVGRANVLFRKLNYSPRPWASSGGNHAAQPTGAGGSGLASTWPGAQTPPLCSHSAGRAAGRQRPSAGCLFRNRGFFYCQRNTGLLIKVGEGLFWASPGPHPKRSLGAAGGLLGPS